MINYKRLRRFAGGGPFESEEEEQESMQMFLDVYKDPLLALLKYREAYGITAVTADDAANDPQVKAAQESFLNGIGKVVENPVNKPRPSKTLLKTSSGIGSLKVSTASNSMDRMVGNAQTAFDKNADPSTRKAAGMAMGMDAAVEATKAIDNALMGDKNFGALSAAIDSAVHGVSGALMKSGNPYAMAAGAALEGANFLTKAGGQTVQGFDVDINSSGYGNLGHMESKSNRDFGAFLGLGGLNQAKINRQLQNRNELAQMALKAANISDTIQFEQEARMNSVDDTIRQNEIALAGGIDTSLLAAKHGGKLVQKAQDGAKLEDIKTSETPNVLPTGELHKNLNGLPLDHITSKGIPVVVISDDSAETFSDVKALESSILQLAEIESLEVIFNKELTDYIEESRKKWHESGEKDKDLLLEVGKRLTKELLYNTTDNDGLIQRLEEKL